MGDSNIGGDGGEVNGDEGGGDDVDGDGSRGTSPSQKSVGTETSVPQNWSSTAAALRNCSGKNADFLGFSVGRLYIGEGASSGGGPGGLTPWWRGQEGGRHPRV
jgi:hypothetical protein